jgi:acetyl-CoA acetyltransferase
MGNCAEICSKKYNISKSEQDSYALLSMKRSREANKNGFFKKEIVEFKEKEQTFNIDEELKKDINESKLRNLPPSFQKNGSVTAGNASILSDGFIYYN